MSITVELEVPEELSGFRLPEGVAHRLDQLLDQQNGGATLSDDERREAEGLVNLAEMLSLLRLKGERLSRDLRERRCCDL